MKTKYITLLLLALIFSSCSKWLDVRSEFDIYEEAMFESHQGFATALNGLYIELSKSSLYGNELVYGSIEAWSRNYLITNSVKEYEKFYNLMNFNYNNTEVVGLSENLWLKPYYVIANANNIIKNIENTDITFRFGDVGKNMIKAEAYAIRALMHFELVRIFAKAPITDNGGVTATVSYVDKYPSLVNLPIPTKDVLDRIIADLIKAKEWIKPFDTSTDYPGRTSYSTGKVENRLKLNTKTSLGGNDLDKYRANRLNYYAITQLLARVALYKGDEASLDIAYDNASEIIKLVEEGMEGGFKPYKFTQPALINNPILTTSTLHPRLHTEIIFGTYKKDLDKITVSYFGDKATIRAILNDEDNEIFSPRDYRYRTIYNTNHLSKFLVEGNSTNEASMKEASETVPIMRFPEAYYIAAESIYDKNKSEAIAIFNKVIAKRSPDPDYILDGSGDKSIFIDAIVSEYRREFLCEGYMVYVYKRLNMPIRDAGLEVSPSRLVLPVPNIEAGT